MKHRERGSRAIGSGSERDANARMALQKLILVLLVLFGIVTLTCLAAAVYAWISQPPQTIRVTPPASPATIDQVDSRVRKIEQDYEHLRLKLDYAEKQSDLMQHTIAALVWIAAIYAAALGLTAYFNLKQVVEAGKDELNRLADYREMIRAQFPALGEMDSALASILALSSRVLDVRTVDWRSKLFDRLDTDPMAKQRIALAEFAVGAFGFFSLDKVVSYSRQASQVYHHLGRVYGSKYVTDREQGREPLEADRCRSILYFETALTFCHEVAARRAQIKADLGLMYLERSFSLQQEEQCKRQREIAEQHFRNSLEDESNQPSALLAIAWIEKRDHTVREAIQTLTELIKGADPDDEESRRFARKAYFNRACYVCLENAAASQGTNWFHSPLADLSAAKALVPEEEWNDWLKDLDQDTKAGGDLAILFEKVPEELTALKRSPDRASIMQHRNIPNPILSRILKLLRL